MNAQEFTRLANVAEVSSGSAVAREFDGHAVLICNSQGRFFAIENRCSHADAELACGVIRNGWIACPAHGARFDLESGEALTGPARNPIRTFALRVVGDVIEVAAGPQAK